MATGFSDKLLADIKALAPAGFRLARNATITDTLGELADGMPKDWVKVYVEAGYAYGDPVLLWALFNNGAIRWSDIKIDDFHGVLEKAKPYGLVHGVVAARNENGRTSMLSVARSDRRYTDAELFLCNELLTEALHDGPAAPLLKRAEREVLWALSQGQTLQGLAQQTGTPISTIKDRLRRARITLGAKTATQAVAEAARKQLI